MKIMDSAKELMGKHKTASFLAIGGAGAAVLNTVITLPLMGLVQMVGQGASGIVLNEAIKGGETMAEKTNAGVTGHMIKSGFLAVGGGAVAAAGAILPIDHITHFITMSMMTGAAIGIFEGGMEKFKRRDKTQEVVVEKKGESIFTAKGQPEHSEHYEAMRKRNFKATEEEVEANELSLSKSVFNKKR